jgi:hypothetical protein
MPTTLPAKARRRSFQFGCSDARLARLVAAFIYLLLVAWNVSALQQDFASVKLTAADGNYNPMEPAR